jgi:regulator of sigma D
MDFNENIYDLIDRYLNGELQGQELTDFEQQISSIPQLKDEIKIQEELLAHFNNEPLEVEESDVSLGNFLGSKEANAFQNKLNKTLATHKDQQKEKALEAKVRKMNWKPLALVASILLIVGFFYINNMSTVANPQDLFAEYSKPEKLSVITKGSTEDIISSIENDFNTGDYTKANSQLSTLMDTLSTSHFNWFDLKLAEGISSLELNKNEEAKAIFNELRKTDYLNAPKADWHYILTLLKLGETENVKTEINNYLNSDKKYKAKDLEKIQKKLQ